MFFTCSIGEDSWESSNQSTLKEISPEYSFIGRTDAEAPILWLPDAKNWLTGEDPDAGKDWRQEKGWTEDEMVGWHHQLDEHELEQAPGVGDRQGNLACCSRKELDETKQLNWLMNVMNKFWWILLILRDLTPIWKQRQQSWWDTERVWTRTVVIKRKEQVPGTDQNHSVCNVWLDQPLDSQPGDSYWSWFLNPVWLIFVMPDHLALRLDLITNKYNFLKSCSNILVYR